MQLRLEQREDEQKVMRQDKAKIFIHRLPVYVFSKDQTRVPDKSRSLI